MVSLRMEQKWTLIEVLFLHILIDGMKNIMLGYAKIKLNFLHLETVLKKAIGNYHKVKGELKMKLDYNEYRKTIERLAPETTNPTYDYEFDTISNVFDDMSYREHIELINDLLIHDVSDDDKKILEAWKERFQDLNDEYIFNDVMKHIGKAFNMRQICDMAHVPYQSYRNYSSTGKNLSYENMRKLTAKMGGISRYVNEIVKANK